MIDTVSKIEYHTLAIFQEGLAEGKSATTLLSFLFQIATVLWRLYIENQKHIPNFWMYDVFLLDKQLSIWRIAQNRCPFL